MICTKYAQYFNKYREQLYANALLDRKKLPDQAGNSAIHHAIRPADGN